MLRFILTRNHQDNESRANWQEFETLDIQMPLLEEALKRGGHGESGHDITHMMGVEILKQQDETLSAEEYAAMKK